MKIKKVSLKENAPMGSFEHLRSLVREAVEANKSLFPTQNRTDGTPADLYPYVRYMFLTHVIVEVGDKYYDVPFSLSPDDGSVLLGKAVEVLEMFVVKEKDIEDLKPKSTKDTDEKKKKDKDGKKKPFLKESIDVELKECGVTERGKTEESDFNLGDFISITEAFFNESTGVLENVILIEQGFNPQKRRLYPDQTIREAAPNFKGLKMYINHQTVKEENDRPERDLRDWASTVVESYYEDGSAKGNIAVHDSWLRERLADPVAREHIGLSISAGGQISMGTKDGQKIQIVEKIVMSRRNGSASVDWVTEAGARGRVSRLLKETKFERGVEMDLKEATLEDLRRENPQLVDEFAQSVKESIANDETTKKANAEAEENKKKVVLFEKAEADRQRGEKVQAWLKENKKLPDLAKARITDELKERVFESEEKLRECFDARVKSELDYLNKLSESGRITTPSGSGDEKDNSAKAQLQESLDKRAGVVEEKKDSKE